MYRMGRVVMLGPYVLVDNPGSHMPECLFHKEGVTV